MAEQIEIKLMLNFTDKNESEEPDLISVNDSKAEILHKGKIIDLIRLLQISKQLYDAESNRVNAQSEKKRLNNLKKSIALDMLGKS